MVDVVSGKNGQGTAGMTARLKVGIQSLDAPSVGLSRAEKRLSDIVDISSLAQERVQKTRKLDSYLRLFGSVLKYFNGTSARAYTPLYTSVEVEYVKTENPYLKKTDTTV